MSIPFIARAHDHQAYTAPAVAGAWGGLLLGELLARSLFERAPRDRRTAVRVEFPTAWQWPSLACGALMAARDADGIRETRADLVKVNF